MVHVQWARRGAATGAPSTAQYASLQGTETLEQREGKKSEKGERNISAEARPSYLKYDYLIQTSSAQRGGSPACLHAWSALHACSLVMKETDPAQCHTSFLIGEKLDLNLAWDTAVGLQEEVAREPGPAGAAAGKHCQQLLCLCWLCDGHRGGHGWAIHPVFSSIPPNFQFWSYLRKILKPEFSSSFAQPRVYVSFLVWGYFRSCTLCSVGRMLEELKELLLTPRTSENLGIQYWALSQSCLWRLVKVIQKLPLAHKRRMCLSSHVDLIGFWEGKSKIRKHREITSLNYQNNWLRTWNSPLHRVFPVHKDYWGFACQPCYILSAQRNCV